MDMIRIATIEDAPELASMHVASWRETYAGILPDVMFSAFSVEGRTVARAFYERFGGQAVEEREDVRKEATLVEVAYGWANLKAFDVRSGATKQGSAVTE
jgi:hypothetical protein